MSVIKLLLLGLFMLLIDIVIALCLRGRII